MGGATLRQLVFGAIKTRLSKPQGVSSSQCHQVQEITQNVGDRHIWLPSSMILPSTTIHYPVMGSKRAYCYILKIYETMCSGDLQWHHFPPENTCYMTLEEHPNLIHIFGYEPVSLVKTRL